MNGAGESPICVAIDGPSASGKSTVSQRVAVRLDFAYVDSGAMYRGLTWQAVRTGLDVHDAEAVVALLKVSRWAFRLDGKVVRFLINGEDPEAELRSEPVRRRVAAVAMIPEVRGWMVARQREMVQFGHLVMEGRDIGSVVFPHTRYKFFLDADPEVRAARRHREIGAKNSKERLEAIAEELRRRDAIDRTREVAPLQIALGAMVIDTSRLTVDEVVDSVVSHVRRIRRETGQ